MNDDTPTATSWTVLIVDDEPDIRAYLQGMLERTIPGLRTITASDGAEGLVRLEREAVDLVLSDQRMPGMEGTAFLARAATMKPDVPRILLTGYADVATAVHAVNDGHVSAFLQKPARKEVLVEEVLRLLKRHDAERLRAAAFARSVGGAEGPAKGGAP